MILSLVLPVYNVEAYLGKCLDSCLHQNLPKSEYEIIVVIDGSPDHSIDVAKKYRETNGNIKIVSRVNGGLSAARNTGLKAASGDFVWFIDSDDYIEENILGGIVGQLKENCLDCLWIDWQEVTGEAKIIPPFAPHSYSKSKCVYSGKEFMTKILSNYLFAWSFIYRRSFLLNNALTFTEGMYYEDTDFAFRSLPLLRRIQQYGNICYNYLQRDGSIVHHTNMRKLEDIAKNCVSANGALGDCEPSLKRFYKICFTSYYMLFVKEVLKSNNKEYEEFLITQSIAHGFGKVCLFGNLKTKIIGLLYNLFGVKETCNIMKIVMGKR